MRGTAYWRVGVISQPRHNYPMHRILKRMKCLWWLIKPSPLHSWGMLDTGEKNAKANLFFFNGGKSGLVTTSYSPYYVSNLTKVPGKFLPSCQLLITGRWQGILGFSEAPDRPGSFLPSSQRYLLIFVRFWDNVRLPLTALCHSFIEVKNNSRNWLQAHECPASWSFLIRTRCKS